MVKKIFSRGTTELLTELRLADGGGDVSKQWYVCYWIDGKRYKKYGGLNSLPTKELRYELAKTMFSEIEKELQAAVPKSKKITQLQVDIEMFIEQRKPLWRKKTIQTYVSKCTILKNWIDENRIRDWNKESAERFERYLRATVAKSTFNEYVRIFDWIFKELYPGKETYFAGMKKYSGDIKTPALYFQQYQRKRLAKIFQEEEPYLWLFIQFIFYAFIRPGELRLLKVGDIFIEERKILVRAEIAKNKRRQFVQIPNPLFSAILESNLLSYPEDYYLFSSCLEPGPKPIGQRYMSSRHQTLLKKHGFDTTKHKLYSWKHTGAVACYKAGMKIKDLQLQMRHASIEETDGYLRSLGIDDVAANIVDIFPEI